MEVRIYDNKEVLPLGTKFKSKVDHFGTTIRKYKISEIYRTYNTNRQLVMVKYDLSCSDKCSGIYGVNHSNLIAHYRFEIKNKKKLN